MTRSLLLVPISVILLCSLLTQASAAAKATKPVVKPEAAPESSLLQVTTTQKTWALKDSIQTALAYSPQVHLTREKVRESEATLRSYYSNLFPTVDGSLSWTENKDPLAFNPKYQGHSYNLYTAGISAVQPIYRGGLTTHAIAGQRRIMEAYVLDRDIAERDVIASVTRAYYQLVVAQRNVDIQKRIRQIQLDLLKTAESRYRIGREEQLSVLQIKTSVALSEPQVAQAINGRSLAAAQFANLLGIQTEKEIQIQVPSAPMRFKNLDQAALQAKGQSETYELKKSQLSIAIADEVKFSALSVNWPKLDAIANVSRSGNQRGDLLDRDATSYSIGLKLSVPIFSGLSSFYQRTQLSSQVEQARIVDKATRDLNGVQRVQTEQQLDSSRVVLKASEEALNQAEESVKVATRTYRLGTSTYIQVSQSQTSLAQAEIAFEQAQYQFISQLLDFSVAHGIDVTTIPPIIESATL